MAVGLLLLGVLLVVVLLRLRALAGRGLDSEIKTRLDTLSAQNERLERELRAELARARTEGAQHSQIARAELSANLNQVRTTAWRRRSRRGWRSCVATTRRSSSSWGQRSMNY